LVRVSISARKQRQQRQQRTDKRQNSEQVEQPGLPCRKSHKRQSVGCIAACWLETGAYLNDAERRLSRQSSDRQRGSTAAGVWRQAGLAVGHDASLQSCPAAFPTLFLLCLML
jgi:hypothetical protein